MLITVHRNRYSDQSTQGQLGLNGIFECYTLEPRQDQSYGKPYCIPANTYDYRIGWSDKEQRNVIKVLNVPGFTDIEVHPGNYPKNTLGCTLVGHTEANDFVGQSDDEFEALMSKIPATGKIEYIDNEWGVT